MSHLDVRTGARLLLAAGVAFALALVGLLADWAVITPFAFLVGELLTVLGMVLITTPPRVRSPGEPGSTSPPAPDSDVEAPSHPGSAHASD